MSAIIENRSNAPILSVVAPCYNEADGLRQLYSRVTECCRGEVGQHYEIVLADDGSSDATWRTMEDLAREDDHVVAIKLARNYGHQIALTAGLQLCRGERVLIIDADLQDPPELLPAMMRLMDGGADVVFGQRQRRDGETAFKRLSASIFYRITRFVAEVDLPRDTGDFRLISRRALNVLNSMPERFRFVRGMVSWIGLTQVPLLYDRRPRFAGDGHYPFRKMLRLAVDAITSFSIMPLRVASYLGLCMSMAGFLMIGYALGGWLLGRAAPGWTSLASIVLIVGSVQLLVLGVIGEYVGRLYLEAKQRPLFVVDKVYSRSAACSPIPTAMAAPIIPPRATADQHAAAFDPGFTGDWRPGVRC